MPSSLLIKDALIVTQDAERRLLRGDVRVEDGRIAHVGPGAPQHADITIDADGDILMPGLVNAHTHAAMTLMRGMADDLPLERWLGERVWPAEAKLTRSDIEAGSDLAILEMIRGGQTAFNDMYFFADATAERAAAAGIRARIGAVFIDFDAPGLPRARQEENARRFVKQWGSHALVRPTLAPHAVYSCSDTVLGEVARVRDETRAVQVHTHVAETRSEVQDTMSKRGGLRPHAVLEKHDLVRGSVLAHCGWTTKDEVRAMAAAGAHAAHCPVSNMKLGTGGTMPLVEMLDAGVNVALGTDGAASNNSLDLFETAKFAALVQKQHRWDASAASAQQMLDALTRGGARALGTGPGALEVGAPADMALVSTRAPHMAPLHDPVSALVYAARASDVRATIVAGRVLYFDGEFATLDAARVISKAKDAAKALSRGDGGAAAQGVHR